MSIMSDWFKKAKSEEDVLEELSEPGAYDTSAGVYLGNRKAQHSRYNKDIDARLKYPEQSGSHVSLPTFKNMCNSSAVPFPKATPEDWKILKDDCGLTHIGGREPMLQNSLDAHVDTFCSSGHYMVIGIEKGAECFGISQRTLERRKANRSISYFDLGGSHAFNCTTGTNDLNKKK